MVIPTLRTSLCVLHFNPINVVHFDLVALMLCVCNVYLVLPDREKKHVMSELRIIVIIVQTAAAHTDSREKTGGPRVGLKLTTLWL